MKIPFLAIIILTLVLSVVVSSTSASITVTQQTVPTGYAAGTLSYANGQFIANTASGEVTALLGGTWQGRGFNASRPAWTNAGIACYDQQGYASVWDGTNLQRVTEDAQFSGPFVQPVCSANGDVAFGRYMTNFLLVSRPNGDVDGYMPFTSLGWSGSWWTVSAAFTPGGTMYVAGQNTATAANDGYRVVGQYAGSFFDTGMSYSQVAYGGGMLWGTTYDHRKVEAWSLYANGSVNQKVTVAQGGLYDLLGGDQCGVMYKDASNIWYAQSATPEPGSLLALGSGLIGFVGFAARRRRP